MNKTYRSVWNESTGTWVAASEVAKSHGKKSRSSRKAQVALGFLSVAGLAGSAHASAIDGGYIGSQSGGNTIAIGTNASASTAPGGIAIGAGGTAGMYSTKVTAGNATAIGIAATAAGSDSVAMGTNAMALASGAIVLGLNSTAKGSNGMALGASSTASTANSVALGANSLANSSTLTTAGFAPVGGTPISAATAAGGEVSVGKAGAERRITNVAAGLSGTDAVNVSQLMAEDARVNLVNSNVANLSSTVNNISIASVNVTNLTNIVNNITNGGGIKYFHSNSTRADSLASGSDAIAIGGAATASGNWAQAIGELAQATGDSSLAIGDATSASASNSVALGAHASASASNSVALGAYSTTTANLSAAGYNPGTSALSGTASVANGEVSVGASGKERRITNVAAGSAATDAVNVSQLMAEDARVNLVNNNVANLSSTVNNISTASVNVTNLTNIVNNITNGGGIKYFHANSTGEDSTAAGSNAIAVGSSAKGMGSADVAMGLNALAQSTTTYSATALGAGATASGDGTVAVGVNAKTTGPWSASLGQNAQATASTSLALGASANASTVNSVALGANSLANSTTLTTAGFTPANGTAISAATAAGGEVSVGASGKERRITNVAAGLSGTDAVNVSQLQSEDAKVNNVSNNVANLSNTVNNFSATGNTVNNIVNGGGTKYFHANSTLADSQAKGQNSVSIGGAAISEANESVTIGDGAWTYSSATNAVALGKASLVTSYATNAMALGANATATTANSVALGANSLANSSTLTTAGFTPANGTAISAATAAGGEVSVGKSGAERRITNVAAGLNGTDAVNVSQLMAEDARVNLVNNNVANLSSTVNNINTASVNVTNLTNIVNNITNGGGIKYFHSNSTRADSLASGTDAIAIGGATTASGNWAQAIGELALATGASSLAVGDATTASGSSAVALGAHATAATAGSVALGLGSVANRGNAVSVGTTSSQRQIVNVAAGTQDNDAVVVQQLKGVTSAIGGGATVAADGSVTAPTFVVNGGTYSNVGDALTGIANGTGSKYIQFGNSTGSVAYASGNNTIAIGGSSVANNDNSVAIGTGARAIATGAIALGYGSLASVNNTFSVGSAAIQRRIVNVADGIDASDAATVGRVTTDIANALAGLRTTTPLLKSAVLQASPQLLGQTSTLTPDQMLMAGPTMKGGNIQALGTDSVAMGLAVKATADNALALGTLVTTTDYQGVGIGQNVAASGINTVAIGSNITTLGSGTVAIGNNYTDVEGSAAVGIGNNATVVADNSVGIGSNLTATGSGSVVLGYSSSDGGRKNVVSVGSSKQQRQIINVAAGYAGTDAVNVSQLSNVTAALGGGATVNADGSIKKPTYNVQGKTQTDVGTALAALDGGLANVSNNLTNVTSTVTNIMNGGGIKYFHATSSLGDSSAAGAESVAIGGGAVATTANSIALGSGSVASSASLVTKGFAPGNATLSGATAFGELSIGTSGQERRITNVAAGLNPTDAVNVSQLMAEDARVNVLSNAVNNISGTPNLKYFHADMTSPLADSTASGANSVAIGGLATASTSNSVALGSYATTTANLSAAAFNPLTTANLSGATAFGEVSIGAAGKERRLTNLAAGSADTDAVNVSQLKSEDAKVNAEGTAAAAAFGGGATYDPTTGSMSAPAFVAGGTTYNNVAGAITNLDGRVTNLGNNVTNLTQNFNNVVNGGGIKYFHADKNSTLADSSASGVNSVAIGGAATASTSNSVALGSYSTASSTTLSTAGFAPGGATLSGATAFGEVSVGVAGKERRITNVAAGYAATDAVNVSQLMAEDMKVNNVSGNVTNLGNVVNNIAGNVNNISNNFTNVVNGGGIKYFHADANSSLADSSASGKDSVAIGGAATASTSNSVALGSFSTAGSSTLSTAGFAPGGATLSGATAFGEVSIGAAGKERRLTNLAAGSADTDAVNVSQLKSEDAKVNAEGTAAAAAFGGGATYDPTTGNMSAPAFVAGGTTYNNVAGAITNLDGRVTNLGNNVTNLTQNFNNVVNGGGIKYFHADKNSTLADSSASGVNSVAIGGAATASTSNSVALGSYSTASSSTLSTAGFAPGGATLSGATAFGEVSVGVAGKERRITNVAAGYAATDAVNVSQLMAEDMKVNNVSGNVTNLGNVVNNIAGNVNNISNNFTNVVNGGGIKYFHADANSSLADSSASGVNSVAIGGAATASTSNSVALGSYSTAGSTTLSTAGFAPGGATLSGAMAFGEVSVGAVGKERRITNVAAGYAATDAVNVSQLMAEDAKVNLVNNNVGDLANVVNNLANGGGNMKYFHANSSLADSSAVGVDSVAAGPNARATADNSVALGSNSVADRANTVSVGSSTSQRQIVNVAAGVQPTDAVNVSQLSGVTKALGGGSSVGADGSIVAPAYNVLGTLYSNVGDALASLTTAGGFADSLKYIKFGPTGAAQAQANGNDSVAIGGNSIASGDATLAIGAGARALASGAVAVGYGSLAKVANTFAVGSVAQQRRIVNVADGIDNSDAATVGQVTTDIANAIAGLQSTTLLKSAALRSSPQLLGQTSSVTPDQMLMAGPTMKGGNIQAVGTDAVAMGLAVKATANNALAIGTVVTTTDYQGVGIGQNIAASGTNAVAIGSNITTLGSGTVAIGNNYTDVEGTASVGIGNNVTVVGDNSLGLGTNVTSTGTSSIVLGYGSTDGGIANVMSVGNAKTGLTRRIINVAAGTGNTDAVNVSQLNGVMSNIGGGMSVKADGSIAAPSFALNGQTFVSVAGALSGLDTRTLANTTDITNLQTQINRAGSGLVTQDASSHNILVASTADGSVVDFSGTKGARKLTGVLAGSDSNDAANVAQLSSVTNAIGSGATVNADGSVTGPTFNIGGTTINTIGGAITNLDTRVADNTTSINNINSMLNNISFVGTGVKYFHANSTMADSLAQGMDSIAIGGGATAIGNSSVALGAGSIATDAMTVSVGTTTSQRRITNVADGIDAHDAVNMGQLEAAGIINGNGKAGAVTYDQKDGTTNYSSITLGDGSENASPTVIHNVADGSAPNDAVNYSQYQALADKIAGISNATVNGNSPMFQADGDVNTQPAFVAAGSNSTAMGASATASGNQSVATGFSSKASGATSVAIGANATASGNNSVALGAGSIATDDNTVSVGNANQQRRVTNVATGTADTDAVNVGQMNQAINNASANMASQAVQAANSYTDQQFNKMNDKMNSLGAAAMAATSLIPNARAEGNFQMSAAAGTYGGAAAVAIGANYWINDRTLVNAHVTRSTGNGASTGASAGVTFGF